MELNERINNCWTTEISRSKSEIVRDIEGKMASYRWTNYIWENIDYSEFKIHDGKIEINCLPGSFTAFRPYGKIILTMTENRIGKTDLECEILPMNGNLKFLVYLNLIILSSFC